MFETTIAGNGLIVSILSAARSEGYHNTLVRGKRTNWVGGKMRSWFARNPAGDGNSGILYGYNQYSADNMMRKISSAETYAKRLYDSHNHQNDQSGDSDETMPFCDNIF